MFISKQSNLQIQCNCSQNSNTMFPINRTNNLKTCMEPPKLPWIAKTNLTKNDAGGITPPDLKLSSKLQQSKWCGIGIVVQSPRHFQLLRPHRLQHSRLPYPPSSPEVCPSSCPLHQWCNYSHFIFWGNLLLLPSIFPSIREFSNESAVCIRWPKYWNFSFSISPSNEYSGLISLKINWFDLLAAHGTLWSLLQHHISKASILWHSISFTVQLSQPYVTTRKTIALTIMDLCQQSNVSAFQHTVLVCHSFLAKKQSCLTSWLQSPCTVILEPKKRKSATNFTISPSTCMN